MSSSKKRQSNSTTSHQKTEGCRLSTCHHQPLSNLVSCPHNRRQDTIILFIIAFAIALWMYSGYFYLVCPFHWLTGLQCPLCGMQRAISALLHLHPIEAFWYNPWLLVLAPYSIIILAASLSQSYTKHIIFKWCYKGKTVITIVAMTVLWGILRNVLF